jgi:hypothetical protein
MLLARIGRASTEKTGETCRFAPVAALCDARDRLRCGFGGSAQCLHERLFPVLQLHRRKRCQGKPMHARPPFATLEALQGRDFAIQEDQALAPPLISLSGT